MLLIEGLGVPSVLLTLFLVWLLIKPTILVRHSSLYKTSKRGSFTIILVYDIWGNYQRCLVDCALLDWTRRVIERARIMVIRVRVYFFYNLLLLLPRHAAPLSRLVAPSIRLTDQIGVSLIQTHLEAVFGNLLQSGVLFVLRIVHLIIKDFLALFPLHPHHNTILAHPLPTIRRIITALLLLRLPARRNVQLINNNLDILRRLHKFGCRASLFTVLVIFYVGFRLQFRIRIHLRLSRQHRRGFIASLDNRASQILWSQIIPPHTISHHYLLIIDDIWLL